MYREPLDSFPLWSLFLFVCAVGGIAIEAGYRFGGWRHARAAEEKESPVGAMVGSILGLLAFLLAFTFSLAASRFDDRREAVLEEANAIGTTYLRARLLPEPERIEMARLLREYVDVRVHATQPGKLEEAIASSEKLHVALWSEAVKAAESKKANPVMIAAFVQSLNQTIDLHAKRVHAGARSRIPLSIWVILFGLVLLSMAAIGYQAGLSATRRSPAMPALVLAFAAVLFLIGDLDRGAEGFLKVSQQELVDVQKSMAASK